MPSSAVQQIAPIPAANLPPGASAAINANTAMLNESGQAALGGFQELAKAYQALAVRNAEQLTASIQALGAVRSLVEFFEVQQRLIKDGIDSALQDGRNITGIAVGLFSSAFEPVKARAEAVQKAATN